MKLRLGRPDLDRYADRFDLVAAEGLLGVTFAGVSTLLLDDGESAILTDGFFSRPGLLDVALRRIAPDHERITNGLQRLLGASQTLLGIDAVIPVHSHFDHALDSAVVAESTGARLVGGESTANIGTGHGLPAERVLLARPREATRLGAFTITMIESRHCPPDRYPGKITEPLRPPARASAYKCGEAWSLLLRHESGRTALVQGSAGYVEGALSGHAADVAYLGVGQLGLQSEEYLTTYWDETVQTIGARRAVLIHWDDFFRPLDQPLRALPYAGDDLDATMRVLGRLAERDGVILSFPTVWRREDPWAGLA